MRKSHRQDTGSDDVVVRFCLIKATARCCKVFKVCLKGCLRSLDAVFAWPLV